MRVCRPSGSAVLLWPMQRIPGHTLTHEHMVAYLGQLIKLLAYSIHIGWLSVLLQKSGLATTTPCLGR